MMPLGEDAGRLPSLRAASRGPSCPHGVVRLRPSVRGPARGPRSPPPHALQLLVLSESFVKASRLGAPGKRSRSSVAERFMSCARAGARKYR